MKSVNAGQRFGWLVSVQKSESRSHKEETWVCRCDCGSETIATKHQLISGRKKSCGCLRKQTPQNALDLTGQQFGKLVAVERAETTKQGTALWLCQCDCGNTVKIRATTLRRGEAVSCGCERQSQAESARRVLQTEKTVDGVPTPLLTKKVRSDSSTGHKGVYRRVRKGNVYYEANLTIKGKRYYAGPFASIESAIKARKDLEEIYYKTYLDKN